MLGWIILLPYPGREPYLGLRRHIVSSTRMAFLLRREIDSVNEERIEENRGIEVIMVTAVFLFIATLFVFLRWLARRINKAPLGADDYWIFAALVCKYCICCKLHNTDFTRFLHMELAFPRSWVSHRLRSNFVHILTTTTGATIGGVGRHRTEVSPETVELALKVYTFYF